MSPPLIWALLDERQGNTSQTIGVAEALGLPYVTKQLAFNPFIRLPNFLVNSNTLGIDSQARAQLAPPWPDITIGTARRLGLVASYIKYRHPSTFLAQIQWPGSPSRQFDLIATPIHDKIATGGNIITTFGAPHRVTDTKLATEAERWQAQLAHLPSPRITVLIGGGNSEQAFGDRHGKALAELMNGLAESLGGSLLITTSRRTGEPMVRELGRHLRAPHFFYAWQEGKPEANPYYGFLGLADAVVATGDSVSMCSEACATGKPVYIYTADDFTSRKHRAFLESLYERGFAKPLTTETLQPFTPPYRLNEAFAIADEIRKRVPLT